MAPKSKKNKEAKVLSMDAHKKGLEQPATKHIQTEGERLGDKAYRQETTIDEIKKQEANEKLPKAPSFFDYVVSEGYSLTLDKKDEIVKKDAKQVLEEMEKLLLEKVGNSEPMPRTALQKFQDGLKRAKEKGIVREDQIVGTQEKVEVIGPIKASTDSPSMDYTHPLEIKFDENGQTVMPIAEEVVKPSITLQNIKEAGMPQTPQEVKEFAKKYEKLEFTTDRAGWTHVHAPKANKYLAPMKGTGIYVKVEDTYNGPGSYFCKHVFNGTTTLIEFNYLDKKGKWAASDSAWNWIMDELLKTSDYLRKQIVKKHVAKLEQYEKDGSLDGKVIENLLDEAYHSGPGASNSMLGQLEESCAHLDEHSNKDPEEEEPRYFILGRAFHDYILRPLMFDDTTMVIPPKKYSKEGLLTQRIQELEGAGRCIITEKELRDFVKAKKSIERHPIGRILLQEGKNEVSAYSTVTVKDNEGQNHSVLSRVRFDKIIENPSEELRRWIYESQGIAGDYVVIADLKYLKENTDLGDKAARAFYSHRYHCAESYYCTVAQQIYKKRAVFLFLTVAKDKIKDTLVFNLGESFRKLGDETNAELIVKYATAFKNPMYNAIQAFKKLNLAETEGISEEEKSEILQLLSLSKVPTDMPEELLGEPLLDRVMADNPRLSEFFGQRPELKWKVGKTLGWRGRSGEIISLEAPKFAISYEIEKKPYLIGEEDQETA